MTDFADVIGKMILAQVRDGEAVSITGRLEAEKLITKRTAVLVSGLLLSPSTLRDAVVLGVDNGLMVHSIELGSVGHDLEFDDWDVLTTVDGKPYDDPNRLFAYLKEAQESERSVTVEILRFSENLAIFDYLQRELLVEDLELISGQ